MNAEDRNLLFLLERLRTSYTPVTPDGQPLSTAIARCQEFLNRYRGQNAENNREKVPRLPD